MPALELTYEEIQLLENVLEENLSDLRMEIVDTDRVEFKNALKYRRSLFVSILEKLQQFEKVPAI